MLQSLKLKNAYKRLQEDSLRLADERFNLVVIGELSRGKSTFVNGRAVKQKRAHYEKLRQQLQKAQTPSSRRRLKAIGKQKSGGGKTPPPRQIFGCRETPG